MLYCKTFIVGDKLMNCFKENNLNVVLIKFTYIREKMNGWFD